MSYEERYYTEDELRGLGITRLKEIARAKKIKGYSTYKKANKNKLETLIFDEQRKASPTRGSSPRRTASKGKDRASPKQGPSSTKVLTREELKKLNVPTLKDMLVKDHPDALKELRKNLKESDPARKSPNPRKNEIIKAILDRNSKGKERASSKQGSPRRNSKGKERASSKQGSPRRNSKGKGRASSKQGSPRRSSKDKTTPELEIELGGWTVVGELEAAYLFLNSFDRSRLMERIENEGEKGGLVRLEPDPGCEVNCGAEALGIKMDAKKYGVYTKITRGFVQEVKLGEMNGTNTAKADFSFLQTLVIADLSALLSYIEDKTLEDIKTDIKDASTPRGIVLFDNPSETKTPKLMNVLFPGKEPKRPYKGFLLQKAK